MMNPCQTAPADRRQPTVPASGAALDLGAAPRNRGAMSASPRRGSGRTGYPVAVPRGGADGRRFPGGIAMVALAAGLLGMGPGTSRAQQGLRNYTEPILVPGGGAHSAPIWALSFTPDGQMLVSAGQDKVVHVWDLRDGRPRVVQTIRPPIWRGHRGDIYALALAPVADDGDGRLLAVAGYGADQPGGAILLYRLPGREDRPAGDLVAVLPGGVEDGERPAVGRTGHTGSVRALAFSPDGRRLASGGFDGVTRLWDVGTRANTLNLPNGESPVTHLAFSPDGRRLVVAAEDGSLRLWDLADGARRVLVRPDANQVDPSRPGEAAVEALAASPDGRWLVIGRRNGVLARYDAATLANPMILRRGDRTGGVMGLAFGAESSTIVASTLSRRLDDPAERPRTECDVELLAVADGRVLLTLPTMSDVARACAFSPDGRWLAVGGGNRQAIALKDLRDPARPTVELKGHGSSLWDVGFAPEGLVVAFARSRPIAPGEVPAFAGFDLGERRFVDVDPAGLRRAAVRFEGWSVRPVAPRSLEVLDPQGLRRFSIVLDDARGRWWSYTFLPPGPGHDAATVAIGTEGGISIYRLDDGRRTRELAGHGAAVYALAPSPDGRWLVSGSADQTVRLWALDGCDAAPPLGASIRRDARGDWVVAEVVPGSPAEQVGAEPGDVVLDFYIDSNTPIAPEEFLARADAAEPGTTLRLDVRSGDEVFFLATTKKDSPALSLFPGVDREWVVWTPQGFYDTSIAGDHRFLGWHVNRLADPGDFTTLRPSAYYPMSRFERQLRRPAVLDGLLAAAGRAREEAPPIPIPPTVALATPGREPGRAVDRPELSLAVTVAADEGRGIAAVELRNGGELQARQDFPEPRPASVSLPGLTARLRPGENRLTVVAIDDGGLMGLSQLRTTLIEPKLPARQGSRLVVRTIGIEQFRGGEVPRIDYAGRDAADLARFLVAPGERRRFPTGAIDSRILAGSDATAKQVAEVFDALRSEGEGADLRAGDSVFVAIESHFLDFDGGPDVLLAADSGGSPPSPTVPAALVAETLGQLADDGCTVVLLLDIIHDPATTDRLERMKDWVRDLGYSRHVITLLASKDGPGLRRIESEHGTFAEAVLRSLEVRGTVRPFVDPTGPVTLDDFEATVLHLVEELSSGEQSAGSYVSEAIPPQLPLFEPAVPAVAEAPGP